jgi:hypothetical protein
VSTVLHDILVEFHPLMAGYGVHVDTAVQPGLAADFDVGLFRSVLPVVLDCAVRASVDGHLLITAMRLGPKVQIVVSDDGPTADRATREGDLRASGHLIGLQGGSLDIDARQGEGTTVTLRLPVPMGDTGRADPVAKQAAPAPIAS